MRVQDQMQAIVDRLVGAPPEALPTFSALDEPWRTIYCRAAPADDFAEAEACIWRATEGLELEVRRQLTRDLIDLLPGGDAFIPFPSLHEMAGQFPAVDWLWPGWIPRGMVTLLGGAPGAGKSLVALDLARRIIQGEAFPDGAPVACPDRNVLMVDAEGAPAMLNQRAEAWDVDRRRLFLLVPPDPAGVIDLAHPEQQELLRDMCHHLEPPLVVVDSLAAATARGETSLQGARALLGFLASVAREGDLAVLLVHHLRKRARTGRPAAAPQVVADDLRGSSHISAAARSVLALSLPGRSPRPDGVGRGGLRRLEVVKTNLCCRPPPLGLLFEGEDVPVPTLRYTPFVEPPPPPTQVERCARWLLRFLAAAGAPAKPADVVRAAGEAGFPRRTLYRARKALADAVVDLGTSPRDPHKRWVLAPPPSPTPPEEGPRSEEGPRPEDGPGPEGASRDTGSVAE